MSAREKPRQNLGDHGMEDLLQKRCLILPVVSTRSLVFLQCILHAGRTSVWAASTSQALPKAVLKDCFGPTSTRRESHKEQERRKIIPLGLANFHLSGGWSLRLPRIAQTMHRPFPGLTPDAHVAPQKLLTCDPIYHCGRNNCGSRSAYLTLLGKRTLVNRMNAGGCEDPGGVSAHGTGT